MAYKQKRKKWIRIGKSDIDDKIKLKKAIQSIKGAGWELQKRGDIYYIR